MNSPMKGREVRDSGGTNGAYTGLKGLKEHAFSLGGWDMRDWTLVVFFKALVLFYHPSNSQYHTT